MGFIAALLILEATLRFVVGLGNPPLTVSHPRIDYMCKPSSDYVRFGNHFSTNRYGMRSDEISPEREEPDVRILVIGDSVPNGGNLTDQSELASEILKEEVEKELSVPVHVANISAGSWCPANMLAYIKEFGSFDADAAVIVLNRLDIDDYLRFEPLNPNTHPTDPPFSAATELFSRYLFPRIKKYLPLGRPTEHDLPMPDAPTKDCTNELRELLQLLKSRSIETFVVYHPFGSEWHSGEFVPAEAYHVIRSISDSQEVEFHSLAPAYRKSEQAGIPAYRDPYHPNAVGQSIIASGILQKFSETGLLETWKLKQIKPSKKS